MLPQLVMEGVQWQYRALRTRDCVYLSSSCTFFKCSCIMLTLSLFSSMATSATSNCFSRSCWAGRSTVGLGQQQQVGLMRWRGHKTQMTHGVCKAG